MQKLEKFNRAVFFSVFSAIGILSVTLAILGPELKNLYKVKAAARQSDENNAQIEQLLDDHQELINLINKDPNILKRLAPPELGDNSQDANMPAAQITADALAQAKAVLDQSSEEKIPDGQIPAWLMRATLNSSRIVLFASGAGLILVSFVCFAGGKQDGKSGKK